MSNREIRIDLADGRYAVMRGFIKNRDRSAYNRAIFGDQKVSAGEIDAQNGDISLEVGSMIGANDSLIKILLLDYCGNASDPFEALMDSEFGDDYEEIGRRVQSVFSGDKSRPKE